LNCPEIEWYDKVWVIGEVFFQDWIFHCFGELFMNENICSVNPKSPFFTDLTESQAKELLQRIRTRAKEAGLI